VNDNSFITNAYDYKHNTLGISYQYSPNTSFGISWDKVTFDRPEANTLQDTGGWERFRVEMSVRF